MELLRTCAACILLGVPAFAAWSSRSFLGKVNNSDRSISVELGAEAMDAASSVGIRTNTAQFFAAKGVLSLARGKCSAEEAIEAWKARSENTSLFIDTFGESRPNGIVQVDDGATGCMDYSQFGSQRSPVMSRTVQVLTLVHHSCPDICLSDLATRDLPDFRTTPMRLFKVKGEMTKLNAVRGYGVIWPAKYFCRDSPCAIVVSLQGVYERATFPRNEFDFQAMATSGLMRILQKDERCSGTLRSVVVFPQILKNESWVKDGPRLLAEFVLPLLKDMKARAPGNLDENRVAITGYSEGAFGALHAAAHYPHVFTMAVAVSASLRSWENVHFLDRSQEQAEEEAKSWKLKAVLVALAEKDESGDQPQNLKRVLDFMSRAGLGTRVATHMRLYAGLGHNHWEKVYNNWPALHDVIWHADYSKLWGSDAQEPEPATI